MDEELDFYSKIPFSNDANGEFLKNMYRIRLKKVRLSFESNLVRS
jgi:hypothetical protein